MVIGKIKSVSEEGITIFTDAESEAMYEAKIPSLPEGTALLIRDGEWHVDTSAVTEVGQKKRLEEADAFYYLTRNFLPYGVYEYVLGKFPTNCVEKWKENPYFLMDVTKEGSETPICTFPQIDKAVCVSTFDARLKEICACMRHVLNKCMEMGDTWMPYEEFSNKVKSLLASSGHPLLTGSVAAYLHYFKDEFYFKEDNPTRVAFQTVWKQEFAIYRTTRFAAESECPMPLFEPEANDVLSDEQMKAMKGLILKGGHISILTGGPGTGKTTILKALVSSVKEFYPDKEIYLLATTGKAGKRIKEVFFGMDIEVSTVHRFLGFGHPLTGNDRKRIKRAGVIIIDESSMLDLEIFDRLLYLLDLSVTKLILVGDVNQLPSVGAGNVLSDLISLGVHTEYLTVNFRSTSSINANAARINEGIPLLTEDEDFVIREIPPKMAASIAGMDGADVVITPFKAETKDGNTAAINKNIQAKIFKDFPPLYESNGFRVGDSIIMMHTNYKGGYFNGETGFLTAILPDGAFQIDLGDRKVTVKDADDMALGYAITAHKSQGSEYEFVELIIPQYSDFITRKLLYTAVTRGKKKVVVLASRETLRKVILNNPEVRRRTFLSDFPKL